MILEPGLFVVHWGHFQEVWQALVRILRGPGGRVWDGEADVQGPNVCGFQWGGTVSGLRPDDGGGVAVACVDAGGGGLPLVGEVGWLTFEVGLQVHKP